MDSPENLSRVIVIRILTIVSSFRLALYAKVQFFLCFAFREYYFQEGNHVYSKLEVAEAYKRALNTWAQWVDANINSTTTRVFFRGYSASHFK